MDYTMYFSDNVPYRHITFHHISWWRVYNPQLHQDWEQLDFNWGLHLFSSKETMIKLKVHLKIVKKPKRKPTSLKHKPQEPTLPSVPWEGTSSA